MTPHERAFWRAVDAQPDCVCCGGKCHAKGNRQLCCWCGQSMSFELTWHWHGGRRWQVRTWA